MAPVARSAGRITSGMEDEGATPRSPDELEAEALAEVRGLEQTMQARAAAAFPDKTDPIRIYGEGLTASGVAHVRSMGKMTRAMSARLGALLTTAEQTAKAQTEAATAKAEADRAAGKLEAVEVMRAGLGEVLAVDRRARYGRAMGIAGAGAALVLGVGLLAGYGWGRASVTADAADKLAALQRETASATAALAASQTQIREMASEMKRAVADAGAGLSVLRTIGTLPEGERAAMNGILDALAGAANGSKPGPQLQAVRELMALPAAARAQAMEFARTGDVQFRASFLPVMRLAEERSKSTWWAGETVYPGCLTNGPTLPVKSGGAIPTCLVQLPDAWQSSGDAYLRANHYGAPAR